MSVYNALKYNVSFANAGSLVLLTTNTASSSSSLSFTSKLNSTYSEYIFLCNNMHPATQSAFSFNLSTDSGSNYNVTKTASYFKAHHNEAGNNTQLAIEPGNAVEQGTGYQNLGDSCGTGDDESISGYLHLFEPSSTTFVKHFIANFSEYNGSDFIRNTYIAGYGNTTSAVDAIDFKFSSGNVDAGTIQMFGVVK